MQLLQLQELRIRRHSKRHQPERANPFIVTGVPAKVCDNRSDNSISQETLEKLQAITGGHSQPTGTITMDRYELSRPQGSTQDSTQAAKAAGEA